MQKRLGDRSVVKVTAFITEKQIRNESGSASDVLSKLLEFVGKQRDPAKRVAGNQYQHQGRKYSPDTARVKLQKAETAAFKVFKNDRRDQETRNNKKNVDANETAFYQGWKGVKADHRKNRQRTETINVGAIFRMNGIFDDFGGLCLNRYFPVSFVERQNYVALLSRFASDLVKFPWLAHQSGSFHIV
jgi:hypothetical protein